MIDNRISRESSRLIASLSPDTRYIKFIQWEGCFTAVICSQVTDEELSDIFAGDDRFWTFEDRAKAVRSIRRLNKDIQIYQGSFTSAFNDS